MGSVVVIIIVLILSVLLFFPQLLPQNIVNLNQGDGVSIAGKQDQAWKDYQTKSGFEIKAPADFDVLIEESTSSASGEFDSDLTIISSDTEPGQFSIAYPVLKTSSSKFSQGLDSVTDIHPDVKKSLAKSEVIETEVSGKKAKILLLVNSPTPPAGMEKNSSWCNCTYKYVYVDLGEKGILPIFISYNNNNTNLGKTFDQILSTLKL